MNEIILKPQNSPKPK